MKDLIMPKSKHRIYLRIECGDTGASNDNMFTREDETEYVYEDISVDDNIDLTQIREFYWGAAPGCWKEVRILYHESCDRSIFFGDVKDIKDINFSSATDFLTSQDSMDTSGYFGCCSEPKYITNKLKKDLLQKCLDRLRGN